MNDIPDMLTVADVARKLRRCPRYVRDLIHCGMLKAVRISKPGGGRGRFLVRPDSVAKLLGVSVQRESEESLYRRAKAAAVRQGYRQEPGDGTL